MRKEWDASLSVIAATIFWVVAGMSSRPLEPAQSLFGAAAAMGVTVGLAAFVAGRWVSDRLSKDEYGALIASFDPSESKTQRPYLIMSLIGLTTAIGGILLAITAVELSRFLAVILYGLMFGLAMYCVLGSMSLVIISYRHQRRAAILRAIKEDIAREQRRRKGET